MRNALAFFTLCLFMDASASAEFTLCKGIMLKEGRLNLNMNEKVLVCGSDRGGEGWRSVPLPQAQLHLTAIFQSLGHLSPRFERDGDQLLVWSGPRTNVKRLKVEGAESVLDPSKKRKIVGEPMKPDKLNEVQAWANSEVRAAGYACPQIDVEAHRWDQTIVVKTGLGQKQRVAGLTATGIEGLNEDVFKRYRPFEAGNVYDIRETQLLTSRLLSDGLFQSAFVTARCRGGEVDLVLHASVGKPKILRFGIGASTEEFPFVDAWFRNARLDSKASSVTTTLHASPRQQSLTLGSELYLIPWSHRTFLGPRLRVERESENAYEVNSARIGSDLGRNFDIWDLRIVTKGGPTMNYVNTVRGLGPADSTFLTIDGSLFVMSHVYEFLIAEQFEGWTANFLFRGQRKGLESPININRYELQFKQFWNIGSYSPPLFVLGTRLQAITVATDRDRNTLDDVPIEQRVFAGGDHNLRGFPRKSLDNQGRGYLTLGYVGFELRLIEQLPFRLQPLALLDVGRLGMSRDAMDPPVFISQGLGLRWPSPFGTFYGTAARGHVWGADSTTRGYPEEWVYFLSFGQGF